MTPTHWERNTWDPGTVKHVLNDWSYIVLTDGYDTRGNCISIWERTCSNGEMMINSEQDTSRTSDPINSGNNLFKEAVEQSNNGKD